MSETVRSPAVTKHTFKPLAKCENLAEAFDSREFIERIEASVPQHIQPNRMLRTFVQAVNKTPALAKVDLRSFIGACLTLSQVGLEANTPLGHAYLIPFDTRVWNPATRKRDKQITEVQVIFGYPGLLDLSFRTSLVRAVHADVVWPGDEFSFEYGSDAHLRHKPTGMPRGPEVRPIYAYMHATLKDGQAFEVLPYSEVMLIRDRSQAYRFARSKRDEAAEKGWSVPAAWSAAPWVAHEIPMARKTAFRSGSKWLPRSVELSSAIAIDEAMDRRRRIDLGGVLDAPSIDGRIDYLGAATDLAEGNDPTGEEEQERSEQATRGGSDERKGGNAERTPTTPRGGVVAPEPPPAEDDTRPGTVTPREDEQAEGEEFEAMLVDQFGALASGTQFRREIDFARGLMALWTRIRDDAQAVANLIEHNTDAIEQARLDAGAASVLGPLLEPSQPTTGSSNGAAHAVIEVPQERGKPSWTAYSRVIKQALARVAPGELLAWADAQRATIARAPMGQRGLIIPAIENACRIGGQATPIWFAELLRKPSDEGPPLELTNDEEEAERIIMRLRAANSATVLETVIRDIEPFMRRVNRDNKPLFNRVDVVLADKIRQYKPKG